MSGKFFVEIDGSLTATRDAYGVTKQVSDASLLVAGRAVATMAAVAACRRDIVQARGIGAQLHVDDCSFSFTIEYNDGGYCMLSASTDDQYNRVGLHERCIAAGWTNSAGLVPSPGDGQP